MALRVPSIGMVAPGKPKISQLNSLANSDETAKPFKEDQSVVQMHPASPFSRANLMQTLSAVAVDSDLGQRFSHCAQNSGSFQLLKNQS